MVRKVFVCSVGMTMSGEDFPKALIALSSFLYY